MISNDYPFGPQELTVERTDNHVYFYADVDKDRCLALIKKIREVDAELRNERDSRETDAIVPIWLHIQSDGGDLMAAFALADQLRQIKTPIYSVIEGVAASAATILAMSCTKRFILPSSFVLIHQLSSMSWGSYESIKDYMKLLDMLMNELVAFYVENSKASEAEIREMLKQDTWLSSKEAIAKGFVDEFKSTKTRVKGKL